MKLTTDRACVRKAPKTPVVWGSESFWVVEHRDFLGEWPPERAQNLQAPPHLALCFSRIRMFICIFIILFIIN